MKRAGIPGIASLVVLAFCLAAARPAAAGVNLSLQKRFFEGDEGTVVVFGSIPDQIVVAIDDPVIAPESADADRVVLTLRTVASPGAVRRFAKQVVIPRLKKHTGLLVEGYDVHHGNHTVYGDYALEADPPLAISLSRDRLTSAETFTLNARFTAAFGWLPGGWEVVGKTIRVPLGVGCNVYCSFEDPVEEFDLVSAPIGPLPAGEYTLEVYGIYETLLRIYLRQPLTVLPEPATVRNGRFTIEVLLDPPHGGKARLVDAPSEDAALFYFFDPANWEMLVKVLDGCALGGHYWVFGAASTDVGYTVVVRDTSTGASREYRHTAGAPAPAIADTAAFACDTGQGAAP